MLHSIIVREAEVRGKCRFAWMLRCTWGAGLVRHWRLVACLPCVVITGLLHICIVWLSPAYLRIRIVRLKFRCPGRGFFKSFVWLEMYICRFAFMPVSQMNSRRFLNFLFASRIGHLWAKESLRRGSLPSLFLIHELLKMWKLKPVISILQNDNASRSGATVYRRGDGWIKTCARWIAKC